MFTYSEQAATAQQRIKLLNAEQQLIYRTALHRTLGLTTEELSRLDQIAYEIALALDEHDRACRVESVYEGEKL
jgi:uncharacterized HAD superfamily protein